MLWAHFLHFYQPPTQKEIWVRRISQECYRKVFRGLRNVKGARLTININGVLCELLEKYGGADILDDIRELLQKGVIELTGSAKYHAFLPLLPESEIERQIRLNEETLRTYFGDGWKKEGFFSPEMAYSKKVATVAAKLGYRWIIADELACGGKELPRKEIHDIRGLGNFGVYFRERGLSFVISSAQMGAVPSVLRHIGKRLEENQYVITAMDGETFGHHRPGLETLLFDILKEPKIKSVAVSDLAGVFPKEEPMEPLDSTWAASAENIRKNAAFSRWKNNANSIQDDQWRLTDLAVAVVARSGEHGQARTLLDEALHSDQYWWSSARPWWSLEMIERGAHELLAVVQSAPGVHTEEKKLAEGFYRNIVYAGFDWQRSGKVDELAREENEEILALQERTERPYITRDEYHHMISVLKEQMALSAKAEEYHRAAMIKERILELTEEAQRAHE